MLDEVTANIADMRIAVRKGSGKVFSIKDSSEKLSAD
jgi:hypothetical protein